MANPFYGLAMVEQYLCRDRRREAACSVSVKTRSEISGNWIKIR